MIDVLLVDDHAVVRTGYKTFLSLSDEIGNIYEADRGEQACHLYSEKQPDVVVCDLSMPGIGGFETIRRLISRDPQCRVLVFSIHDEPVYVQRAMKSGAKGYIVKNSSPELLVEGVCQIANGESYVTPELAQKMALNIGKEDEVEDKIKRLTSREFDVFCLLAKGLTTKEAAEQMCLSYKTVCNHATVIKEKMSLKTGAEMTLMASQLGLIKHGFTDEFASS